MHYIWYIHTCYIMHIHIKDYIHSTLHTIYILCSYKGQWNVINLYSQPSSVWILIIFYRRDLCANLRWWSLENMRFPRQSAVVAYMNRTYWGPRCRLPLITPHLDRFCVAFLMKRRSEQQLSFSHLAFLHTLKSSVRDDKLQFGERSSEILTRGPPANHPIN